MRFLQLLNGQNNLLTTNNINFFSDMDVKYRSINRETRNSNYDPH